MVRFLGFHPAIGYSKMLEMLHIIIVNYQSEIHCAKMLYSTENNILCYSTLKFYEIIIVINNT
jgi:hypothetical protein